MALSGTKKKKEQHRRNGSDTLIGFSLKRHDPGQKKNWKRRKKKNGRRWVGD